MENCQICDKRITLRDDEDDPEFKANMEMLNKGFKFIPSKWMGLCSWPCAHDAVRYNALWNFKDLLRNHERISFEKFNNVFNFSSDGGYAAAKYRLWKLNPLGFVYGTDKKTFRGFIKLKD